MQTPMHPCARVRLWAKGPTHASPGQRPGFPSNNVRALKGRHNQPRNMFRPFRARTLPISNPGRWLAHPPSPSIPIRLLGPGLACLGPLAHSGRPCAKCMTRSKCGAGEGCSSAGMALPVVVLQASLFAGTADGPALRFAIAGGWPGEHGRLAGGSSRLATTDFPLRSHSARAPRHEDLPGCPVFGRGLASSDIAGSSSRWGRRDPHAGRGCSPEMRDRCAMRFGSAIAVSTSRFDKLKTLSPAEGLKAPSLPRGKSPLLGGHKANRPEEVILRAAWGFD